MIRFMLRATKRIWKDLKYTLLDPALTGDRFTRPGGNPAEASDRALKALRATIAAIDNNGQPEARRAAALAHREALRWAISGQEGWKPRRNPATGFGSASDRLGSASAGLRSARASRLG